MAAITKETTILDLLEHYPEAREVFARLGLRCVGCLGMERETVETSARMHGLAVTEILDALNAVLDPGGRDPAPG